jgi:hypothetical protein
MRQRMKARSPFLMDFTGQLSTLTLDYRAAAARDSEDRKPARMEPGTAVRIDIAGTARVFEYS